MTVDTWIRDATKQLENAGIGTARLDALVLLEDALHTNRTQLLAHLDTPMPPEVLEVLQKQLGRRAHHEPLAYLRGKSEFYGREFVVSAAVLEPRPESETMIELLIRQADLPVRPHIADVGTGSGALGITAQLELPEAKVDLLEIDDQAMAVAETNVINFATGQKVLKSDLLAQAPCEYDILLCNLPYVPDTHIINQAATHEPRLAIFGGPDGLDLYRKLFQQIVILKNRPLLILTESLPTQHSALADIAMTAGYAVPTTEDFIQVFHPAR